MILVSYYPKARAWTMGAPPFVGSADGPSLGSSKGSNSVGLSSHSGAISSQGSDHLLQGEGVVTDEHSSLQQALP